MAVSGKYLLIDGHSVIYAWPHLRKLHEKDRRAARMQLIDQLGKFHDISDWLVTLVFDGQQGVVEKAQKGKMVVLYAQSHQTADAIIERLVAKVPDSTQVWVVTADGGERRMVESLGAISVDPKWLQREIENETGVWSKELDKIHLKAKW
ncbi:MAG: NYN domain-containing protein [Verrucomicrobiota bacterium]